MEEMNMDLLNAVFGGGWEKPENYDKRCDELQPAGVVASEDESAAFDAAMQTADADGIQDGTLAPVIGRLQNGQFHRAVQRLYGEHIADLAYDAHCTRESAILNTDNWKAFKQLQQVHPELAHIVISRQAWRQDYRPDREPSGNGWGE